jgi:hypothetical protein
MRRNAACSRKRRPQVRSGTNFSRLRRIGRSWPPSDPSLSADIQNSASEASTRRSWLSAPLISPDYILVLLICCCRGAQARLETGNLAVNAFKLNSRGALVVTGLIRLGPIEREFAALVSKALAVFQGGARRLQRSEPLLQFVSRHPEIPKIQHPGAKPPAPLVFASNTFVFCIGPGTGER